MPRFGIEYTFVHSSAKAHEDEDCILGGSTRDYRRLIEKLKQLDPDAFKNTSDDSCVEVRSPIHHTVEGAQSFYERIRESIDKLPLTARYVQRQKDGSECYYGTGGGHVHVELPGPGKLRKRVMFNLIRMVANRPWLSWVFNEFMDDINAKALYGNTDVQKFMRGEFELKRQLTWSSLNEEDQGDPYQLALRNVTGGKDWAIRFKKWNQRTMTVEFRFFDAPRSWGQARDHIEMALALVKRATEMAKEGREAVATIRTDGQFQYHKRRDVVEREFKKLCDKLGLKWSRYRKYMKNFDDRRDNGELI